MSIQKHGLALEPLHGGGWFFHVGRLELFVWPNNEIRRFGYGRDASGYRQLYVGPVMIAAGRASERCEYGTHCI